MDNQLKAFAQHGASFDWIDTGHMTPAAAEVMYEAARLCLDFAPKGERREPRCLILSSAPAVESEYITGYGVGKTRLAQVVHALNSTPYKLDEDYMFETKGKFIASADLLALFNARGFSLDEFIQSCFNLLIIDDLGREGTIQFESRDGYTQVKAIQDRYYKVIESCLKHSISIMITTNLDGKKLLNYIGGAAWSRLNRVRLSSISMSVIPDYAYREKKEEKHNTNPGGTNGSGKAHAKQLRK